MSTTKTSSSILNSIQQPASHLLWRLAVAALDVTFFLSVWEIWSEIQHQPVYLHSIKLQAFVAGTFLVLLVANLLTWTKLNTRCQHAIAALERWFRQLSWFNFILALGIVAIYTLFVMNNREYGSLVAGLWVRLFLLMGSSLAITLLLHCATHWTPLECWLLAMTVIGAIWAILPVIPLQLNYPFTLGWSESSWFYYASYFKAQQLYGAGMPWPFLDVGRPMLLSIIFLIPQTPLWLMRIWQVILWIGAAALVTWLLCRRLHLTRAPLEWTFGIWVFACMFVGPVYFYLALGPAVVLAGFDRNRFWKSLLWIGLASLWSGILRINWIPVPAMLGLALYFLETPLSSASSLWQYLKRPIGWAIGGTGLGVGAFWAFSEFSSRIQTTLVSKVTSPFLWYRLLPNSNLHTGILAGTLIVSAALFIVIGLYLRTSKVHPLRSILCLAMLVILLAGGAVASVKIGGGNNLHNMDAYLVLLLLLGAYVLTGQVASETSASPQAPKIHWVWLVLLLCTPTLWVTANASHFVFRDQQAAGTDLQQITAITQAASQQGGQVLFINNRHLLTFHQITGVPLVSDYELEELMEMAMSDNQTYLARFDNDLQMHRFSLIVTPIVNPQIQDADIPFSEENNVWVNDIVKPLMKYYQSADRFENSDIEIFTPKP
jgi:hypothetical protein